MDQSIPRLTQRQQAKAATRAKVVAAASVLFNAKGYDLVTMRDIADKANVSTGAIFGSFSGKQALWEACAGLKMPTPAEWAAAVELLGVAVSDDTIIPFSMPAETEARGIIARAKL